MPACNGDDRIRTKDELAKIFAWWNKEMEPETKEVKESPSDKLLLKMAFGNQ